MKKRIVTLILFSIGLTFSSAYAQMAKQKDLNMDELSKHLNALFSKGDDASKAELIKEAEALSQKKDEQFVSMAARIYQLLDQQDKADEINKRILKKFPKGIKARQDAYQAIFNDDTKSVDALEKAYQAWVKKFPPASFSEENRMIYDQAATRLASRYFEENNTAKGSEYVTKLKSSPNFPLFASNISAPLIKSQQYDIALPILEEAFNLSSSAQKSDDPKIKNGMIARSYSALAPLYAEALIATDDSDKALPLLEDLFQQNPYAASLPANTLLVAKAYSQQGKDLDAFIALDSYLVNNGKNEDIIQAIKPLYAKLNNNKGDFENYISTAEAKAKEALIAKYKGEMIKKEAPLFSLVNREGKTVNLADLKGKVVVLDFWATWCGPCKMSFPGMQAAVNQYKDDNEVAFLFIDTWQSEENYKELVNNFIEENNYTFHVLFDEMKDRGKATTTAYGVRGIPHKVVIDKEGFIRFESSGGSADVEKVRNEISTKIELARKG